MSDNISVTVRVRPFIAREKSCSCWTVEGNILRPIQAGRNTAPYNFDRVYDQLSSNDDVYSHTGAEIVTGAMDGFNGTILAYGQTSSGKTHTMTGGEECPGIIELAVEDMFNIIENSPEREYLIRVSYLEIYQENVFDLLGDLGRHLEVKTNHQGTVFVDGLKENVATSVDDVMSEMKKAEANRHIGATKMNERSSRSHAIFRVIIESHLHTDDPPKSGDVDDAVKVSHLNFVDLAGSENAKQSAVSGQRLAEAGAINKSLSTLTLVIGQLSTGSAFVNYRNSRLTRILQNALGGNSKTAMICMISPASLEQSISTLRFATSAKSVKNKPVVNEVISGETMIKRMKKEINKLKKQLQEVKVRSDNIGGTGNEDKIELLTRLFCVSSQLGGGTSARRTATREVRRRETWCPGRGGMPFVAAGGSTYPQALLSPSMLPKRKSVSSTREDCTKTASERTEGVESWLPVQNEEMKSTGHMDEARKDLDVAKKFIIDLESKEEELIVAKRRITDLESKEEELGVAKQRIIELMSKEEELGVAKQRIIDLESKEEELGVAKQHIIELVSKEEELGVAKQRIIELVSKEEEHKMELTQLQADLEAKKCESCERHLEEIDLVTRNHQDELELIKAEMSEMRSKGMAMIERLGQQVTDLEADLEAKQCESCKLHLGEITDLNEELDMTKTKMTEIWKNGAKKVAELKAELSRATEEKWECSLCQLQQEEIANLKKDRDEAEEELEAERTAICEMKTMGRELIANHKHQVAQLEAELEATKLDNEQYVTRELNLEEIANLKKDRDTANEELEATRTELRELNTMGRGLISNLEHQVAQLEAELKATRLDGQQYVTRESYEMERQRLLTHCDKANTELESTRSKAAGDASNLKDSMAQLAQVNIKKTMLEQELEKVHSRYKSRIRFFVEETESLSVTNKKMQNEIRDLRNKQANESFLQPPVPSRKPKTDDCFEGGRLFELLVANKRLTKQVESLQAALDARGNST